MRTLIMSPLVLALFLFGLLCAGCTGGDSALPETGPGSIRLTVDWPVDTASKMIITVTAGGQAVGTPTTITYPATTATLSNVPSGDVTIKAEAQKADGTPVARGLMQTTVASAAQTPVTMHPTPLGFGVVPGEIFAYVLHMSDQSEVFGFGGTADGAPFTVWKWTRVSGYQQIGQSNFIGQDMNDSGQMVGDAVDSSNRICAVVWTPGAGQQFLPLQTGWVRSYALGINNDGVIVGYGVDDTAESRHHAFRWSAGTGMQLLNGLPGDYDSKAVDISENGIIAGDSSVDDGQHAVIWSPGGVVSDLGPVAAGATYSEMAISSNGEYVTGRYWAGNAIRVFLWSEALGRQTIEQPAFPGFADGVALPIAVNNSGQIAAMVTNDSGSRAYRWTSTEGPQDLGFAADYSVTFPRAMNNQGQIAGLMYNPTTTDQGAFIWTPSEFGE